MINSLRRVVLTRKKLSASGVSAAFLFVCLVAQPLTGQAADAATPKLAASGPSTAEGQERNLLVLNFPETGEKLREEAARLLERAYEVQAQASKSAGVDTYEQIYADVMRLRWLGERLTAQGEQLGIDISKRTEELNSWVIAQFKAAAAKPEWKRDITRRVVSFERAHELAEKKLTRRIDEMFEQKHYVDAYEAYLEIAAPINAQGQWCEEVNSERHPLLQEWETSHRKFLFPAQREVREVAAESRQAVYAKSNVNPQSLISQIRDVAMALKTAPQAQLSDGRMVSGPEALAHFTQGWIELQNKAVRAAAYRQVARYSNDANSPNITPKSYAAACNEILAKFAGLIEADAERASGDEAIDLYDAYLQNLPPLLSRCTMPSAWATIEGALQKLMAKSPPLRNRVEAYHALTDELLRWRRRSAEAYVRSVAAEFPAPERPGLLVEMKATVPDMIARVSRKYLDQDVAVTGFLAIDSAAANTKSTYAVSEMSNQLVFSTKIDHDQLDAAGATFRAEVMAEEVPPPTLAMRLALYRLEKGDFQTAGGTIAWAGIIGVPACYLSVRSDDNRGLVRLGSLQVAEDDVQNDQVMFQFSLSPAWMTDRYWYVPRSATSPAN